MQALHNPNTLGPSYGNDSEPMSFYPIKLQGQYLSYLLTCPLFVSSVLTRSYRKCHVIAQCSTIDGN